MFVQCSNGKSQFERVFQVLVERDMRNQDYPRMINTFRQRERREGIRVTPHVYTTLEEIDRFCDIMEDIIENGVREV